MGEIDIQETTDIDNSGGIDPWKVQKCNGIFRSHTLRVTETC